MTASQTGQAGIDIRPFRIEIPQDALDDLHERLVRTRFAAPAPDDDWAFGTPVEYLRETVAYWRDSFDWRAQEERMNRFPHYLTEIDGQTIHFVHVRSAEADATPLLLTHTYPGSFADFLDMIEPLADPVAHGGRAEDAFHVVIPSIPGFGFSTPVVGRWTLERVAQTWDTLMRGLGYDSYGAHGSDAGAIVSRELAVLDPEGFLGAHVLQLFSFPSGDPAEMAALTEKDQAALAFLGWFQTVGGYNTMNGSRPQTVAAALSDSPVGQLAWNELFENFGNGTSLMSRDDILTQVSLYWLTNTSAGAVRYHYETARSGAEPVVNHGPIGLAMFADDFQSIRPFAERDNSNIVHWAEYDRGGHFASMEVPDLVVGDLRDFFGGRRKA
jgi:epoxide hydrolase